MRIKVEINGSDVEVSDVDSFAKGMEINPATFAGWLKKAKEANEIEPVTRLGNANMYSMDDLRKLVEKHATSSRQLRTLGYVHPDLYKAVEDHRDRLIGVTVERDAEILELKAELQEMEYNSNVEIENLRTLLAEAENNLQRGEANYNGLMAEYTALREVVQLNEDAALSLSE